MTVLSCVRYVDATIFQISKKVLEATMDYLAVSGRFDEPLFNNYKKAMNFIFLFDHNDST